MLSSTSCICSSGYESFFICILSLQKSMQKHRVPSFFQTNTTALHHGDQLRHITPTSSMSLSEVCTSSRSSGGMHLNHSLKGSLLLMLIFCSIQCKDVMEDQDKLSHSSCVPWCPITEAIQVQLLKELLLLCSSCHRLMCCFCSQSHFHLRR